MSSETIIVVPCYNEAERLPVGEFDAFAASEPTVCFILVNDGSRDQTLGILRELEARNPERFQVLDQQPNRGKAEAVRVGMLRAFDRGARYVGYWDADLATPLAEIPRFVSTLDQRAELEIVIGARVKLLGRQIERKPIRHYLGRVFASAVSVALDLAVYDTQCGAKLFRGSEDMRALFAEPFLASWVFDVELIARLDRDRRRGEKPGPGEVICEIPLQRWVDIAGSKVRPSDFVKAVVELIRIYQRYLR